MAQVYFHCVRKHVMVHENLFVQEFSAQIAERPHSLRTSRLAHMDGPRLDLCFLYIIRG